MNSVYSGKFPLQILMIKCATIISAAILLLVWNHLKDLKQPLLL